MDKNWFLRDRGVSLLVDPPTLPPGEFLAVDIETDEKDNIYCMAVCGDAKSVSVFFDFSRVIGDLKYHKLIFHGSKADIAWMEKYGFDMQDVYWDTHVMAYVLCASRPRFGLKVLVKEDLGITYPSYEEIVTDEENIKEACTDRPELQVRRIKHFKRKPDVVLLSLPKRLTLPYLPTETVANYNGLDAWATWRLYSQQRFKARPIDIEYHNRIELPTARVLYDMERKGIRVNLAGLLKSHKRFRKEARNFRKQFLWLVGSPDINIGSPKQVLEALNKAGLKVDGTNENTLLPYKDNPIVAALLGYRGAIKICSTYTRPLFKLGMKDPNNRVYPRFKQETITGRLAAANPNIQNQPGELRGEYEAKPGHVFVNADYSQIELRIPGHFSKEPLMLDAFLNPSKKIHQVTADQIGSDYHTGKTVNFLLTNSGGHVRLAEVAGISVPTAKLFLETYWSKFKVLDQWNQREKALARHNGYMTTLFGRRVPIPDLKSRNFKLRGRAERTAMSVKVQGTASELIKLAMIRLHALGLTAVLSVHDELMFEVLEAEAEATAAIVKSVMESVVKLSVPLVADVGIGRTWAEAKKKD